MTSYWDKYRSKYEPKEHWELRLKFLETHKNKFDEDRLIGLAQVFYNIEFLECKYPEETMTLNEELSKGIVDEHRERQKTKLKRTFVSASEAAESKVYQAPVKRKNGAADNKDTEVPDKKLGLSISEILTTPKENLLNTHTEKKKDFEIIQSYMSRENPISQLIVVKYPNEKTVDQNILTRSAKFSGLSLRFNSCRNSNDTAFLYKLEFRSLDSKNPDDYREFCRITTEFDLKARKTANNKVQHKKYIAQLMEDVEKRLKREHFTIILNNKFYCSEENVVKRMGEENEKEEVEENVKEEIEEENEVGVEEKIEENEEKFAGKEKEDVERKLAMTDLKEEKELTNKKSFISDNYEKVGDNNIGSKLLKLMGWSGSGGLGKNAQGITEPVPIQHLNPKRTGLGVPFKERKGRKNFLKTKKGGGENKTVDVNNFRHVAHEILTNYMNNKELPWYEDLVFSKSFKKEERAVIYDMCTQLRSYKTNLTAQSYGNNLERQMVVSRKLNKDGMAILYDLIMEGDNPKYSFIIPDEFHAYC